MLRLTKLLFALSLLVFGSVAQARSNGPAPGTAAEIAALASAIQALGPQVDPEEAYRAAQVTYSHTYELAQQYQITDGPLIHNTKVNMGLKPRGLCWHWAQDIEKRLNQERFQTLQIHRAVANSFNIRLEHSTAIVSVKGQDFESGIVLDPWRKGGVLFWSPLRDDTRYKWMARDEVLAKKRSQVVHDTTRIARSGGGTKQRGFQ